MGFFRWLLQLFGLASPPKKSSLRPTTSGSDSAVRSTRTGPRRFRLTPTRRTTTRTPSLPYVETAGMAPYRYARYGSQTGHYLDLSLDGDEARLKLLGLPCFHTPEQLADWLDLPLHKLAWLIHRFSGSRPASVKDAHYHFHWVKKSRGGWRLIEAPKSTLKQVQSRLLSDLLDHIPVHGAAHGFTVGRSIMTNARPHVGQAILLKLDLSNFYTSVGFARVVAIFRSLGYSREASIWLGHLTTSATPGNLTFQDQGPYALTQYLRPHLPQGAPTSPMLANLSAYGLDVRIAGLAKSYGATYTRYADDITISGPPELGGALRILIPLISQIIREERFYINRPKRRILRAHQRQTVTGVVVNEKTNISRADFDRLKATLTNCLRHGPSTQNHDQIESFFHHLQGSIAYVAMLNPARGQKLKELFTAIDWTK